MEPGTEGAEGCCTEGGTYPSHNLVIDKGIAYISWYSDGLLMLDVRDPYGPVEIGRYHERGEEFESAERRPPGHLGGVQRGGVPVGLCV